MTKQCSVHGDMTVNQLLELEPGAGAELNALGIDTCCGGSSPLGEAAAEAGVELSVVLRVLEGASGAEPTDL